MEMEMYEDFQHDVNELKMFEEFLDMESIMRRIEKSRHLHSMFVFKETKRRRFNPLLHLTESHFRRSYRFSKENMKRLIEMLKDDLEIDQQNVEGRVRKNQVPIEYQIMAAVRYWGGIEHSDITARVHGVTYRTLLKIVKRVAEALAHKASRYIRMPCLLLEKQKVTKSFYDLAHMSQIIGAVIYTKVKCKRSAIGRDTQIKQDEILHVQIVTDADFKIRDLDFRLKPAKLVKFNAAELFSQSRIKERFEQNEFRGRLLLGDSSMKCSSSLYTPVSCAVTLPEQAFNNAHRLTYEPARICLNLWRKRFAILDKEWHGSSLTNRHVVVALVLLHNMAIEWGDSSLDDKKTLNTSCRPFALNSAKVADEYGRSEFIKKHFNSSMH